MVETNNLFEVSLGKVVDEYGELDEEASKYYTKALAFQDKMNEKLATNKTELKQYQAMYYSMFKAQGINKDASYLMSESLTKAGYDIASLYNLETSVAVEKIRAGIAGQVEPLRAIGIDISESALSKVLNNVGIERSVQQLSYAEKEVARYIAIVEQAGQAQGDFARTFESPANQVRILKNQLQELAQVAGAFVVNAFGKLLTYANAVVMAIKEILISIATLFGWDLSSSGTELSGMSDSVDNIESGLGGAVKKAKEFKKQLMGFDEINNISLPSDTSGSGGGGVATGVDSKLLDSLKEWDNKMDSISGKAQKYRDEILKALGFTRDINGNLKWSWKNMNNILKVVTVIVGVVAGISLIGKIVKLVAGVKNLMTILKTGKGAVSTFGIGLQTLGTGFSNLKTFVGLGVEQFILFRKAGDGVFTALGKTASGLWSLIPVVAKVVGGIAGLVTTTITSYSSMKKLSDGTATTAEAFTKWGVSMAGATASGALIGSVFGPIGAMIGALAGLAISASAGMLGYKDSIEKNREALKELSGALDESKKSFDDQLASIEASANSKMTEMKVVENLKDRLDTLVDANGQVTKGYETQVDFILGELNEALGTEYARTGDLIKNYDEISNSIDKLIETKKREIQLEAYEEKYKETIKRNIELSELRVEAEGRYEQALRDVNDAEEKGWWTRNKANKALEEAEEYLKSVNGQLAENTNSMLSYEEQMIQLTVESTGTLETVTSTAVTSIAEMRNMAEKNTDEYVKQLDTMETATQANLLGQITTVNNLTPQVQERWSNLAKKSAQDFNSGINQVTADTAGAILSSITITEGLTETTKTAWKNLSLKSKEEFEKNISQIEPITKGQILASIAETEGMTANTKTAWYNLSKENKDSYNKALASLDTDTANKIQATINEIDRKQASINQSAQTLGSGANSNFSSGLGSTRTLGESFVLGFARVLDGGNPCGIYSTVANFGIKIFNKFKDTLGIKSPSRKTKELAKFFTQGFDIQLLKSGINTIKQVENFGKNITDSFSNNLKINDSLEDLSQGIKISEKDYSVDTNSFIDYGQVSGNIATVSKIELKGSPFEDMASDIVEAINERKITVNINAKTDKGTIVETSVDGIKEYVNRTGNLPFPVPV